MNFEGNHKNWLMKEVIQERKFDALSEPCDASCIDDNKWRK